LRPNLVNRPALPLDIMSEVDPYFHLSEKLGAFLARLVEEAAEEINIYYTGELSEKEVAPLTRNTVKGVLKRYLGDHVIDVNAAYLAEKKSIIINENKTSTTKGFTNLITVEVKTKSETRK